MKKTILILGFLFFGNFIVLSQNGLEKIIVEKFYVSNIDDSIGSIGNLPVGSITYRIYADMLPGYNFQALYGVSGSNSHSLEVKTSTSFFNNEDFGAISPNGIKVNNLKKNTVLLDSWFSVGAAGSGKVGVLKTQDTDGAIANNNGVLQNTDSIMGLPVYTHDGMIAGTPKGVTFVGFTNELDVFDMISQVGNDFKTINGSIASLGGSTGPNLENIVLIGQFTTEGIFSFKLNVQIGTPSGETEKYVAENPSADEKHISSLVGYFNPNAANNNLPTIFLNLIDTAVVGDQIEINANAIDTDGSIVSVEFFVDGKSIGIDNTAPFSVFYTATNGSHKVTASAIDDQLGVGLSDTFLLFVKENQAPSLSISAPDIAVLGDSVLINAIADDVDGKINSVEFFINTVSIGSDSTFPYSIYWVAQAGLNHITGKAKDDRGLVSAPATDSIRVSKSKPPIVEIINLIDNQKIISGDTIVIMSNATDPDGAVFSVEFFIDNVSIGLDSTNPYSREYVAIKGAHVITAKAIDNMGDVMVSNAVNINVVNNQAPIVLASAPDIALVGDSVTIIANATDIDGKVNSIEFFINEVSVFKDTQAPYSLKWKVLLGSNIITAKATDDRGLFTFSNPIILKGVNNLPPTIKIDYPSNNQNIISGDTLQIIASASDTDGTVTFVEFFVDSVSVGRDSLVPYEAYYKTLAGNHQIFAVAKDDDGDSTVSNPVVIIAQDNQPPSVSISNPKNALVGDLVKLNVNTSDVDGEVVCVEFFVNDVSLGKDTIAPFSINWLAVLGQNIVKAIATDDRGLFSASNSDTINVTNNVPPNILISAADSALVGQNVQITATANDIDGSIVSVQFFVNDVSIGFYTKAPYTITWKAKEGVNSITAKAKDNKGDITTSDIKTIIVISKTTPTNFKPKVEITSPSLNSNFFSGDTLVINASASDSDGTIANVQFFIDGVFSAIDSLLPYSAAIKTVYGQHAITVLAIDNNGDSAVSLPVNINVANRDTVNKAPQITLSAPDTAFAGSDIEILTSVNDSDGVVVSVEFFINNITKGIDTIAPYSFTWIAVEGNNFITAKAKDNKGKTAITSAKNIKVLKALSIQDLSALNDSFTFFPNPTNKDLFIQFNSIAQSPITYKIYSVLGELMMQQTQANCTVNSLLTIDVSYLPIGSYVLELVFDGHASYRKIIKN